MREANLSASGTTVERRRLEDGPTAICVAKTRSTRMKIHTIRIELPWAETRATIYTPDARSIYTNV
jgi:hypothetical protein